MTDAGYVHIGLDHFALPGDPLELALRQGRLHRNFQGYTGHSECDLVQVGVSAIGRVGRLYVQNPKTLAAYQGEVAAGRLPEGRGVRMSAGR